MVVNFCRVAGVGTKVARSVSVYSNHNAPLKRSPSETQGGASPGGVQEIRAANGEVIVVVSIGEPGIGGQAVPVNAAPGGSRALVGYRPGVGPGGIAVAVKINVND